jgi:2-polyprenyl-3-methyl-5-hydroxy-6-metoxy-1,4-benzoquinol methylase
MPGVSAVKDGRGWKTYYRPDELTETACPVCEARKPKDIAHEFGITIARCMRCDVVYTRTPLRDSQSHYRTSIPQVLEKYGAVFRGEQPHPRDRNYDDQLLLLEALSSPGTLLDIGAHAGFFLRRARQRGWRVKGVEPSPTTAAVAREQLHLDVRTGTLFEAGFPEQSFDVVTMLDVLEHLDRPRLLLGEVARLLRPGGRLLVKVPNVRYVLAKHYLLRRLPGAVEDVFDAREHLAFYSHKTLAQLLRTAGFELEVLTVALPIQAGGVVRRALRGAGPELARFLPKGVALPLATDLVAVGRIRPVD